MSNWINCELNLN